jgi:hypothetical protein
MYVSSPRKKWEGPAVRVVEPLGAGLVKVPIGIALVIDSCPPGQFVLVGPPCDCCGVQPRLTISANSNTSIPELAVIHDVHPCCGCSCPRCAEGHNTGKPERHTRACTERFSARMGS